MFHSGDAELSSEGSELLDQLVLILSDTDRQISIEGHTDNLPIATSRFPSNFDLSSGRADTVVRFLLSRNMRADRLRAIGYADIRPLADNATSEGRAKNRRVNIVVHAATTF